MDRDRILNELRGMVTAERFTATRIGSPGCQIRRVAEENIRALEAAIAQMTVDARRVDELLAANNRYLERARRAEAEHPAGEPTAWLCENKDGHRDTTLDADTVETWRRFGRTIKPLYERPA